MGAVKKDAVQFRGGGFFPLLFTLPLHAQDTPVGPEGTQLATQETPAAATNTDALRNAAQNPVASLISVPLQDELQLRREPRRPYPECSEHPAGNSAQHFDKTGT